MFLIQIEKKNKNCAIDDTKQSAHSYTVTVISIAFNKIQANVCVDDKTVYKHSRRGVTLLG
jgi:hypothetical protein